MAAKQGRINAADACVMHACGRFLALCAQGNGSNYSSQSMHKGPGVAVFVMGSSDMLGAPDNSHVSTPSHQLPGG